MTEFAGIMGGWLLPMSVPSPGEAWARAATTAALLLAYVAFVYAVRRAMGDGSLLRGEARWRRHSRSIRERIRRGRRWLVLVRRTSGWWATRLEFAVAIEAFVVLALFLATSTDHLSDRSATEALVARMLPIAGAAGMVVGGVWMIRIYRAPLRLDSRAYWRYRDGA